MSGVSNVSFDHIHIYADALRPLAEYKAEEERHSRFLDALCARPAAERTVAAAPGGACVGWPTVSEPNQAEASSYS